MTAPITRLALASAWLGPAPDRRRAVLLALASAVVAVVGLGCLSAVFLSARINERATSRSFAMAAEGERPAMTRAGLYDETAAGDQIYVYLLRIDDPSVRVVGVDGPPTVGVWWVTPALAQAMRREPSLGRRYAGAHQLATRGVAHPGELLAYRLLPPGTALRERLSARGSSDWIGDGGEVVDRYPIAVAGLALVGVPGLGLLVAGMGPSVGALERRRLLLRSLGAPPRAVVALVAVHVAAVVGPGALVGGLLWWWRAPSFEHVPFVGRAVFPGDLGVPLAAVGETTAAVVLLAVAVGLLRSGRSRGPRPAEVLRVAPRTSRVAPLAAGVCVLAGGVGLPAQGGARVFLAGVVACTLGAVWALPWLLDRAGRRLAGSSATVALLVGRRLCWNARSSARALLAVGTLACLVPVAAAWVAVARDIDPVPAGRSLEVDLHGQLPRSEASALAVATGARLVFGADGSTARFLASSGAGTRRLEAALRDHVVNGDRPGLQVQVPGRNPSHESPLVAWILGAAALAASVGLAALGLHLVTQSVDLGRSRSRLIALGADIGFLQRLAGSEAAGAVAVAGGGCAAVGGLMSWAFVQREGTTQVPFLVIAGVLGVVALAALASGLAASLAARLAASPRR